MSVTLRPVVQDRSPVLLFSTRREEGLEKWWAFSFFSKNNLISFFLFTGSKSLLVEGRWRCSEDSERHFYKICVILTSFEKMSRDRWRFSETEIFRCRNSLPLWLSEEAWLHCLSGFELIARNENGIDILLHPSLLQENKGEIPS